jgi:nitroreductase
MSAAAQVDTAAVDQVLTTTRAVRRRLDLERSVPPEIVLECIRIAMQAPVGADREGPRWMVVTDPEKRQKIAEIYRDPGRDLLAQGVEAAADEHERRVMSSALYLADVLEHVPVHVIPCVHGRWDISDHGHMASSFGSVLPAVWSLQLALRSRGLGSAWTTLHLWRADAVKALLGLPDDATQVALIPVAYTKGSEFQPAKRPPAEERTFWNEWGTTTVPAAAV